MELNIEDLNPKIENSIDDILNCVDSYRRDNQLEALNEVDRTIVDRWLRETMGNSVLFDLVTKGIAIVSIDEDGSIIFNQGKVKGKEYRRYQVASWVGFLYGLFCFAGLGGGIIAAMEVPAYKILAIAFIAMVFVAYTVLSFRFFILAFRKAL